jgi:hypothetical protein
MHNIQESEFRSQNGAARSSEDFGASTILLNSDS